MKELNWKSGEFLGKQDSTGWHLDQFYLVLLNIWNRQEIL